MSTRALVSIIIVNWNGRHWLEPCLSSIYGQDYPFFEILVVDNGSVDGSVDLLKEKFPKVRIIQNQENLGFAEGNNVGIKHAEGSLLLLLNNDTVVERDFLSLLVKELETDSLIAVCQPKIRLLEQPERLDSAGSCPTYTGFLRHYGLFEVDRGQYDHVKDILCPKGACLLIGKDVFDWVGGFDDDFFCYFEESDLIWRIALAGYRIRLVPESVVYHAMGATSRKLNFDFIQFHSNKNRINSYFKNLSLHNLLWLIPFHMSLYFLLILFSTLTLKFSKAGSLLKSLGWNISHFQKTMQKRKQIQRKIRKISDRELFHGKMAPIPWKEYLRDAFWFLWPSSVRRRVHR